MAFLEQRIDSRIERGARGGPTNAGRLKPYLASGALRQVFTWAQALHSYDVSHGCRDAADLESLRSLWWVVNFTPYDGFRFRDWRDYRGVKGTTALRQITSTTYQLQRTYTFGGITVTRDIVKPVAGVQVYNSSDSLLTSSLDTTTGIATVATGTPSYWTGEFDVPVTFADNEWIEDTESTSAGALPILPTIKLEELLIESA